MRTPQREVSRTQISAEVDNPDVEALRESAEANERSFAAEVRLAIRYYLEHGQ